MNCSKKELRELRCSTGAVESAVKGISLALRIRAPGLHGFEVYKFCDVFSHGSAGKGLGQSPSGRRFEPQQGHWRHYKPAASPGPRGTNRGGPALKQRDPVGTASRVRKATPGNHVHQEQDEGQELLAYLFDYSLGAMQANRHTIVLMQTSQNRATRTFMDYESISQAMDGDTSHSQMVTFMEACKTLSRICCYRPHDKKEGICALYERKLKELNPAIREITYDISDLYNFIDGLADMSALVYDHSIQAYLPYDRQWIKQKTLQHLKKLASQR
ncbi:hypothetical protein MTR67_033680 [Solanum verrucosum]|uniref:Enhancer of rudimentary homolog n=1 Tax=Solanum verrucosum TaxID=315347 RepID=A0AAF0ZJI6_SOLVR|nr:hypothetical protein MTR67_033680 [Solanum verrucosum]